MIDPKIQTPTDRAAREELIAKGLLTPLEAIDQWTHIRLNMARIKSNIAKRKAEWAETEGSETAKERRHGRA